MIKYSTKMGYAHRIGFLVRTSKKHARAKHVKRIKITVSYTLSIHINPECLHFLNQIQYKKNISARQNTFIDSVNDLYSTVKQLKSRDFFEFTQKQEQEIKRGFFYALTQSLEEQRQKQPITLLDLQRVLNSEFHIHDQSTIDFIIMSVLEPHSVPLALSTLAYSVLNGACCWSNERSPIDSEFKYALKAMSTPSPYNGSILFNMALDLKNFNPEAKNSPIGNARIQFIIHHKAHLKLLPVEIEFYFANKKELKQFKNELCQDFQDWIFVDKIRWQSTDLCVIPALVGCLLGFIAMISLLALSLTPISPLLLPPLGLVLGLCLASVMQAFEQAQIKKDQAKRQRPIHLLSEKSTLHHATRRRQTTGFFDPRRVIKQQTMQAEIQYPFSVSAK